MGIQHALRAWPLMGNREANPVVAKSFKCNHLQVDGGSAPGDKLAHRTGSNLVQRL